jgi:DNA-binding transcriptional ArsR family regulator
MFAAGGSGFLGRLFSLLPSFFLAAGSNAGGLSSGDGGGGYIDPRFKRVLWYLIASSKGGVNRAKIIDLINSRPANANQIASELKLDYKTVLHHLRVLSENGLVITENKETYGATYFLTPLMEKNYASFQEILARIGTK